MIKIYNATSDLYLELNDYLEDLAAEIAAAELSGEELTIDYKILFLLKPDDLFALAKKRTAQRGRFAKGEKGESLLEKFAMTDDERDFFDEQLDTGAAEVFKKLAAWAKDIDEAYQHEVCFGDTELTGAVDTFSSPRTINDTSLAMTANQYAGYYLVFDDYPLLKFTILSNTTNSITIAADESFPFTVASPMAFSIFSATKVYIIYKINIASTWDANMLQGIENAIQEALVTFIIKEWYLVSRLMDDFEIEQARYLKESDKIRSQLYHVKTPTRRTTDFFN